jgi:hypothetical protein
MVTAPSTSFARGDHRFGLLAAQHRPGDFLGIGEVGEAAFVDRDPGHASRSISSLRSSARLRHDCRAG